MKAAEAKAAEAKAPRPRGQQVVDLDHRHAEEGLACRRRALENELNGLVLQSPLSAERRRRRRQFAAALGGYTKHRAIETPAVFRAHDAAAYVAATAAARVATLATVVKAARRFAAATATAATATAETAVVARRLRWCRWKRQRRRRAREAIHSLEAMRSVQRTFFIGIYVTDMSEQGFEPRCHISQHPWRPPQACTCTGTFRFFRKK